MDIQKLLTACVVYIIAVANIVTALPTFGDEFVHIKVHIPTGTTSTKGLLKPETPLIHHKPVATNHKVIHHYHHRRKPVQKVPIKEPVPILENFYLAELDKHSSFHNENKDHGPQFIEETYLVKEHNDHHHHLENSKAKINTYKIIEENDHVHPLSHKEYDNVPTEIVKVIETLDDHHQQNYHQQEQHHFLKDYSKTPIETVKYIESASELHNHHPPKEYSSLETIKLIENSNNRHQAHPYHQAGQKQQSETIKFINQKPQYHYHNKYLQASEKEISQLILPKNVHQHVQFEMPTQTEDHLIPDIIEETLDNFSTKKAKNHKYEQIQEEINAPYYHEISSTNYNYKPEHDISIEEHIEYDEPEPYSLQKQGQTNNFFVTPVPVAQENPQHYNSDAENFLSNHSDSTSVTKNKFAVQYRKYLPSSKTSADFEQSEDTFHTSLKGDIEHTEEDFSHAVENPNGPETYTGYDSYRADHVQGLNSGGYNQDSA